MYNYKTVLLTGATGTVGSAVRDFEAQKGVHLTLMKATRSIEKAKEVDFRYLDLLDPSSFPGALEDIDIVFLLRPPQISRSSVFDPFIQQARESGVKLIVFLSVQGADKSNIIPHHGIEKSLCASGIPYTFLRPAYFMQNLTGNLKADIVEKDEIAVPAGKAAFALVDVRDMAEVVWEILHAPENYFNKIITLTTRRHYSFSEITQILSDELNRNIRYESQILLPFIVRKWRQTGSFGFSLVMALLHYLPRYQPKPELTKDIDNILGRPPRELKEFVKDHQSSLIKN